MCTSLNDVQLDIKRTTSFGADNTNVNYGCNSSVYTKLKELVPTIIKANCLCHVLHNTARYAMEVLEFDVENLILKIDAEFSRSSIRVQALKDCFSYLDEHYLNIVKHAPTRWVSLYQSLDRLLQIWPAIKVYFLEKGKDECAILQFGNLFLLKKTS